MKKSIIATSAASLALAAMPVVGVFAAAGSNEFTDHLSVTVNSGCTLENGATEGDGDYTDRYFSKNIAVGNYAVLDAAADTDSGVTAAESAGSITIKCNTTSGTVTVTSSGDTTLTGETASNTIATGAAISGSTSNWAIQSNAANAATDPYATYKAHVPGTFLTATASASGTTFNPSYRVYVAQGQAPDTYTGAVTYTVSYQAS